MPGEASHFKLEPEVRRQLRQSRVKNFENAKRAAVLALFFPAGDQTTRLLLILRKKYPGIHSNQVGFPGGKVEETDKDLIETAKRETHEEVGVDPSSIEIVRSLSEVYIPPSNFLVQPFLGLRDIPASFVKDTKEVETIIEVKLADLMHPNHLTEQRLSTSYAQQIVVPAFKLNGYTVWGATAMMLSEIKDLLEKVL